VFENGALRSTSGPKKEEAVRERERDGERTVKSFTEHYRMVKARTVRWSDHVARMRL